MSGKPIPTVDLVVTASGNVKAIYDERVDLTHLGKLSIRRGSHVEPTEDGQWTVDLGPCGGPVLGPFAVRSEALAAEVAWLKEYWLCAGQQAGSEDDPPAASTPLYHVRSIQWDIGRAVPSSLGLPAEVLLQGEPEDFADLLSDRFGWCVLELDVTTVAGPPAAELLSRLAALPQVARSAISLPT
jgi:hypothetical protein